MDTDLKVHDIAMKMLKIDESDTPDEAMRKYYELCKQLNSAYNKACDSDPSKVAKIGKW